jgi:hypothetical protein
MVLLLQISQSVQEIEQVVSLTATMTKAALGLSAFALEKVDRRRSRRHVEDREEEKRRRAERPFKFDQRTLQQIIDEARGKPSVTFRKQQDPIEVEVVSD